MLRRHTSPLTRANALVTALLVITAGCNSGSASNAATLAPTTTIGASQTSAGQSAFTPATTTVAPPTIPPTVPPTVPGPQWEPIAPGPFQVGAMTVTLQDSNRPLTIEVWFPLAATVDVATLARRQYILIPEVFYESPTAYSATADLVAVDAPLPLVVYSHGSGGLRYIDSAYTEALASHGYIVAATDHVGNTAVEVLTNTSTSVEQVALDRPSDVRRVIDALTGTAAVPGLEPIVATVNPDQVAVTGHSFGGETSIAMVTGVTTPLGSSAPDPRVKAIIPIAPAVSQFFTAEQLATIAVPMMVIAGTDDTTTPITPNVTDLWDNTTDVPAYRVELNAAEHQTFTDICAYQQAVGSLPAVPAKIVATIKEYAVQGCSPGDMDAGRAHQITTSYVVRFLDQLFRGAPPIDTTLTPPDATVTARL